MIALVHLVWAPLGPAPLRDFLRSYHSHVSGAEHELMILLNGAGEAGPASPAGRQALLAELDQTDHRLIDLERPLLDLPAYGEAAALLEHERVCFLNSYCEILADGWLGKLEAALSTPGVGLVGAGGSWESQAEWIRGRLRHWPQQLALISGARRDFPRFPNPHIRTSSFMLDRALLLGMGLDQASDKRATYLLESGHASITRKVQERHLRATVVGRDGIAYDVDRWPQSRTFRSGDQENLLLADNQTRDYEHASARRRRRLSRDSWGRHA
jgi:hypothetical protein